MTKPAAITATDKRAAEIVRMYEGNGKVVRKVVIEGKRVEVEFAPEKRQDDDADLISMSK